MTPLPILTFTNTTQDLCLNESLDLSTIITNTTGTIAYYGSQENAENETSPISSTVVGQGISTYFIRASSIFDPTCYTIKSVTITDQNCKYDLALTKKLADGQLSGVKVGDTIQYTITVFNQGNYDAYEIGVIDYLPAGLDFGNTSGWTISGNKCY